MSMFFYDGSACLIVCITFLQANKLAGDLREEINKVK